MAQGPPVSINVHEEAVVSPNCLNPRIRQRCYRAGARYQEGHVYGAVASDFAADHTQRNNYSSEGNVNPYTGKKGTRVPKH